MEFLVLFWILVFCAWVIIAFKFGSMAEQKGYNGIAYGCLCFFLPLLGWCIVAALPDKTLQEKIDRISRQLGIRDNGTQADS